MESQRGPSPGHLLLIRSRSRVCSLPLVHVVETLRCLPIEPLPGAPPFVQGISVLRGEPVPVVDLGLLLGQSEEPQLRRWVALRVGGRRVAVAVEAVLRIVAESALDRHDLPPLLRGAAEKTVRAIATLDQQFLTVLETAHLVPDEVWGRLAPAGAAR